MNSSRLLVSLAVVGLVATITPAQLISLEISPATLLPMPQTLSVTVTNGAGVGLLLPVDAAGQPQPGGFSASRWTGGTDRSLQHSPSPCASGGLASPVWHGNSTGPHQLQ